MCTNPNFIFRIHRTQLARARALLSLYCGFAVERGAFRNLRLVGEYYVLFRRMEDLLDCLEGLEVLTSLRIRTPFGIVAPIVYRVPCNKCVGCLGDRRNQWVTRCMIEQKYHNSTLFLTLTYRDEDLPPCLVRKHYQDFMKRLRSRLPYKIRQYYCGEYGELRCRPHFHSILFGLELPSDATIRFWLTKRGKKVYHAEVGAIPYYSSKWLEDIWGHGFVLIAKAEVNSIKYVANYLDKGKSPVGYVAPPFKGMSNRPAIARQYYDDCQDKLSALKINHIAYSPCKTVKYFSKLLKSSDPELYEQYVERSLSVCQALPKHFKTLGISEFEYLQRVRERQESALQKFGRKKSFAYG